MGKKNTKRLIVAFLILILVFFSYKIVDLTSFNFVKARAINYLCDKYEADKDEFELVDYKPSEFYISSSGEWVQHLAFSDFSFEFKYNDKNFFVNRYKGEFYDDYQIDDIQKWCTEWLQQNVDENIIGIFLDSKNIAYFNYRTHRSNHYIVTESDIEDFILNCNEKKDEYIYLPYRIDKEISGDDYDKYEKYVISSWGEFSELHNIKPLFTRDSKLVRDFYNDSNTNRFIWKIQYRNTH
ncbi:MAG: hypothetical protein J5964_00760 [Eubacterium sp.]|nr:hypothetical protein [Eubacterium sp.]